MATAATPRIALTLVWLLAASLLAVSAPHGRIDERQTMAIKAAGLHECRIWPNHRRVGPGTVVLGCWELPNGSTFKTCENPSSPACFRPDAESTNAMLRGEPWTLQAVKAAPASWRVYAITAADGRVLRTHSAGLEAWGEWSRNGLVVGLAAVLFTGLLTLIVRAVSR